MSENKMKAAVVTDIKKKEILQRDIPSAKPGWVLTKVLGCGICGSM
jgi:threonine dehydrogenase-like Zn-dependent dehydrogenase